MLSGKWIWSFTFWAATLGHLALMVCPVAAQQKVTGYDAVYNSSGSTTSSPAFFDASQFAGGNSTLCSAIYNVLTSTNPLYPSTTGGVIDARGLNSNNTNMICATGTTPWTNGSKTVTAPSTILLPAGTIQIPATWIVPSSTRLIGEGESNPTTAAPGTTIQAESGFSGPMIQFGSSSFCGSMPPCTGISVERLTLDGNLQSIDGIDNKFSQTNTRVDHVTLYRILGIGLLVSDTTSSSANNSGPYTNIVFDTGGHSGTSSTVCAQILNAHGLLTGTRGIHGLRCSVASPDAPAAVLLDASNNSLEDITIVGFYDGVRIGANAAAQSNVLLNVIGDTQEPVGGFTPVNAVHISNNNTVKDLSIMGVSNSGLTGTYTIEDDVTSPHLSDASVGIYALGELVTTNTGNGYTRFSTSPNVASWAVGTAAPSGSCKQGSLYSCTNGPGGTVSCSNGTTSGALWVCGPSGWAANK